MHLLSRVEHLHGKELSLINLLTSRQRALLLREFALPACVIVKHANPCGVAVAGTIEEAYERALASDPVSAFGHGAAVNRPSLPGSARRWRRGSSTSCSHRSTRTPRSRRCSASRRSAILRDQERRGFPRGERDFKRVLGGLLVQDRDWDIEDREEMEIALRRAG